MAIRGLSQVHGRDDRVVSIRSHWRVATHEAVAGAQDASSALCGPTIERRSDDR